MLSGKPYPFKDSASKFSNFNSIFKIYRKANSCWIRPRSLINCLLICLLSFFSLGSWFSPAKSTIRGYIKDRVSNKPISGAEIRLESLFGQKKCSTFSDNRGYYELKDLTFPLFGSLYVLKFSKSGYRTEKETRFFSNGNKYEKSNNLMPNKIPPPPDTTPPVFTINPIKSPVNKPSQSFSGTKEANTSLWLNGKAVIPMGPQTSWVFTVSLTGEKNSYIIFVQDAAGNKSKEIKVEIILDQSAPSKGTIKINKETRYTLSRWVELELSSEDNITDMEKSGQMQFSNDTHYWLSVENYKGLKKWELGEGDGEKIVYVKYGDAAGNWSEPISASIILDMSLPGLKISSPIEASIISGRDE